jgi:hypothetical protein
MDTRTRVLVKRATAKVKTGVPARGFHCYFTVVHSLLLAGWVGTLSIQLHDDSDDLLRDGAVGALLVLVLFMGLAASLSRRRAEQNGAGNKEFSKKVSGVLQVVLVIIAMVDLSVQMNTFFITHSCNMGGFLAGTCYGEAHFTVSRMGLNLITMFLQTAPYIQNMKLVGCKVCALFGMAEYFFVEWWSIAFNIIAVGEVTGWNQAFFFGITILNLVAFTLPLVVMNMFQEKGDYTEWETLYENHMAIVELITDLPVLVVTIKDGLYSGNAVLSAKLMFDIFMIEKNFFWKITHTNYPGDTSQITPWHSSFLARFFPPITYPSSWEMEHMGACTVVAFSCILHMVCLGLTVYSSDPEYARLFVTADAVALAMCMVMLALLNKEGADKARAFLVLIFLFTTMEIGHVFACTYLWKIQDPPISGQDDVILQARLVGSLVTLFVLSLEYFRKGTGCKNWKEFSTFLCTNGAERKKSGGEPAFAIATFVLEWGDMALIAAAVMDQTIDSGVRTVYLVTTCANLGLYILPTIFFMDSPFNVMKSSAHIAACDVLTDIPNLIITFVNKTYKGRKLVVIQISASILLMMKNSCFNPIYYHGSGRARGNSLLGWGSQRKASQEGYAIDMDELNDGQLEMVQRTGTDCL